MVSVILEVVDVQMTTHIHDPPSRKPSLVIRPRIAVRLWLNICAIRAHKSIAEDPATNSKHLYPQTRLGSDSPSIPSTSINHKLPIISNSHTHTCLSSTRSTYLKRLIPNLNINPPIRTNQLPRQSVEPPHHSRKTYITPHHLNSLFATWFMPSLGQAVCTAALFLLQWRIERRDT